MQSPKEPAGFNKEPASGKIVLSVALCLFSIEAYMYGNGKISVLIAK